MLVEDQTTIREMLTEILSRMPEFQVVAQAADLEAALRLACENQPDIIVLDWLFPGGGGLEFLRAMRPLRLQSHVIVLTGNTTEEAVGEALMFGARGFFEKTGNLEEFLHALHTVAAGGAYFGPEAAAIVDRLVKSRQGPAREGGGARRSEVSFATGMVAMMGVL
jgi:DNA-binding NarL/FixJ family response regulator